VAPVHLRDIATHAEGSRSDSRGRCVNDSSTDLNRPRIRRGTTRIQHQARNRMFRLTECAAHAKKGDAGTDSNERLGGRENRHHDGAQIIIARFEKTAEWDASIPK